MDQEPLLSIGELSAASGLSAKALRLYDESGLLPPRRVDPFSGYRSYGADQVPRARRIAALRGVGMGLARIGVLLDLEPAAAAWELRSWWRQEQADSLSRAAAVGLLVRDLWELPEETAMTDDPTLIAASTLHRGHVRPAQQDAVLHTELGPGTLLLAVADGFGAEDALSARILAALEAAVGDALAAGADPTAALEEAWTAAEALVPPGDESGSTLTAALLTGGRLHVAHAGDGRALLVHGDRVDPVTQDHTQVRSLVAAGRLTAEEAEGHPQRAVLNRALAAGATTAPDLLIRRIEPGDLVALLSDGVHAVLDPARLASLLTGADAPEVLAARIVEETLEAGAPDNLALALARVG
ncbi:serine/threonine protein phosphatase [Brachybacterium sp. SGAir0954]|uniref:MerR family transcriptional regulator n=1 Tax=Brachybacterium sp. SGAir0954 TaxID=2571029 RepID=UPI0010CD6AAC|nr:MerR family transcriptional regulator [Brachybacterium sp. SGAir0954]QCR52170.1 serine/threonine protein phosphatase [Brachybacterium sp. SGAir0954]